MPRKDRHPLVGYPSPTPYMEGLVTDGVTLVATGFFLQGRISFDLLKYEGFSATRSRGKDDQYNRLE